MGGVVLSYMADPHLLDTPGYHGLFIRHGRIIPPPGVSHGRCGHRRGGRCLGCPAHQRHRVAVQDSERNPPCQDTIKIRGQPQLGIFGRHIGIGLCRPAIRQAFPAVQLPRLLSPQPDHTRRGLELGATHFRMVLCQDGAVFRTQVDWADGRRFGRVSEPAIVGRILATTTNTIRSCQNIFQQCSHRITYSIIDFSSTLNWGFQSTGPGSNQRPESRYKREHQARPTRGKKRDGSCYCFCYRAGRSKPWRAT
ncbi:hypothetical protein QBC39DRAFT_128341 [Podospora conica]|nr:hypothetical protein QBC39DRAFT_128341 [Schizothecium conicum]